MKYYLLTFLIGAAITGSYSYNQIQKERSAKEILVQENLGYTKYKDYLSVGKSEITEKRRFIGAEVEREDTYTREIKRKQFVFSSDATVAITYTGIYTFGWELNPESYEIKSEGNRIEVVLKNKPKLLTQPATRKPHHTIPVTGWLINEESGVIDLYEGLDKNVLAEGKKMEKDEAIIALCEKTLTAFLQDFLSKQEGVAQVPNIVIKYKQ